jgi:tetratricopeptide (TPR) repeat protein
VNNIANILWSRGDLAGARKMYDRAVVIAQELGDRSIEAGSIVNIAHILMQQGDLKGAQDKLEQAIPIAKQTGEQSILAEAANSVGDINLAQANFSGAKEHYEESLSLRNGLGEKLGIAETWMSMAELLLAQGQPAEAEKLLRDALGEFRKQSSEDDEITAAGLLARALLDQGKSAEARNVIVSVKAQALRVENPYARLNFLVDAGRVDAFSGQLTQGRSTVDSAVKSAADYGFLGTQLHARLILGEIECKKGDATKAHAQLADLQQIARSHGFALIAEKASSLQKN